MVEVTDFSDVPTGMEQFEMEGGKYAVFIHEGPAAAFPATLAAIFQEWLPSSGHQLDQRPHFECLDQNYRYDAPIAREEIWIPIV